LETRLVSELQGERVKLELSDWQLASY